MINKKVIKNGVEDTISFTYLCTTLESLMFKGASLEDSLKDYCEDTKKELKSESFVTPDKDTFIFKLTVSKKF